MIEKKFFKQISKYQHQHPFIKFLVVLFIFLIYLFFTVLQFGFDRGILISLLSWTFFVFCTPIADAGILVDFPVRLITGIRMIHSEILVWIIAFFINIFAYFNDNLIYNETILLKLFKQILSTPFPYWIIIFLSMMGTFLSIHFGDEILDILSMKKKKRNGYEKHISIYKIIVFLFILSIILVLYYFLLKNLGIKIPLF